MARRSGYPIDMTLRLWSDDIPLKQITSNLDLEVGYLYAKDKPMAIEGHLAGRLAKRHYASVASTEGRSVADVSDWLRSTSAKVASEDDLVRLLHAGQVEALFWVAFFGPEPEPVPTPALDPDLVAAIGRLNARVFLENYTDLGSGCPSKIWLPSQSEQRPEAMQSR